MNEREYSAGAEKVESIARGRGQDEGGRADRESAAETPERGKGGSLSQRAAAERAAAAERVAAAQEKQKEQAASAAAAAEAEAERKMRAAEKKARRAERREDRRRNRTPGFGGWLAAVVSLSVAVLALGAVLTVGYFDLSAARGELSDDYRRAAYELAERVEALDTGLAKAQVSEGAALQRALTEVLVQCELAERDLESFPAEGRATAPLAAFFGHAGRQARRMLQKLAAGHALSSEEEREVEALYARVEKMRAAMPELLEHAASAGADDFWAEGSPFASRFAELGRIASEGYGPRGERAQMNGEMPAGEGGEQARRSGGRGGLPAKAGMQEEAASEGGNAEEDPSPERAPQPRDKRRGMGALLAAAQPMGEGEIVERAQAVFSEYGCKELRVAGKAQRMGVVCYQIEFSDGEGRAYTALLTERGGYLAFFDGHEDCSRLRFDKEQCAEAAQKFLERSGYAGMVPVWSSEGGSECRIEFVPETEGVLLYPDRIAVKVCRGSGEVTGLDARLYLRNHKERTFPVPAVAAETVEGNAAKRMELIGVRKALIPEAGGELLCWEVRGMYAGRLYYAYIDAMTGETAEIRTACADGMLH